MKKNSAEDEKPTVKKLKENRDGFQEIGWFGVLTHYFCVERVLSSLRRGARRGMWAELLPGGTDHGTQCATRARRGRVEREKVRTQQGAVQAGLH